MLWLLRVCLLLLLLGVVLYTVNTEVENWCHDEFSRCKSRWDKVRYNLADENYTVPEAQRQPTLSMAAFYAVPDRGLTDSMLRTRLTFKTQPHVGTVLRDGFHVDLPENAMWRGGVLVLGEEVRQQRLRAQQPAAVVSPP